MSKREQIIHVATELHKIIGAIVTRVPSNKVIKSYYRKIDAAMVAPVIVYEAYRDEVYANFREDIDRNDINDFISPKRVKQIKRKYDVSTDTIDMFMSVWKSLSKRMRRYVLKSLINCNSIIDDIE